MKKSELREELEAYLKLEESSLEEAFKGSEFNLDYQLSDAVENTVFICIEDVCIGTDGYYTHADCWIDEIDYNVILDTDFHLGNNIDEFLDNVLDLIKKRDDLEKRLSIIKPIK